MGETIGYIGLGVMGLPFARHLKAAGHDVVVYDRDAAARARAAEAGLRVAAGIAGLHVDDARTEGRDAFGPDDSIVVMRRLDDGAAARDQRL